MRRNEERLPIRREQGRGLSPWSESGFLSPASIFSGSPWQMMRRMQDDMDRMFSQFFGGDVYGNAPAAREQWSPSMDVSQTDREWLVEVELPGVRREDIETQIQDHHLVIRAQMRQEDASPSGQAQDQQAQGRQAQGQQSEAQGQRQYYHRERRFGFFQRVLPLPENVVEENVRCEFRDGVLRIHLPKLEQVSGRGRRIPIGEGSERTYAGAKGGEVSAGEQSAQPQQAQNPPDASGGSGSQSKK